MTAADLRAWRKRLRLTQAEAAALLDISVRQYRYYEAGRKDVPRVLGLATIALELIALMFQMGSSANSRSLTDDQR